MLLQFYGTCLTQNIWGRAEWGLWMRSEQGKKGMRRRAGEGWTWSCRNGQDMHSEEGPAPPSGEPSRKAWGQLAMCKWSAGSCGAVGFKPTFSLPPHSKKRHSTISFSPLMPVWFHFYVVNLFQKYRFIFFLWNLEDFAQLPGLNSFLENHRDVSYLSLPFLLSPQGTSAWETDTQAVSSFPGIPSLMPILMLNASLFCVPHLVGAWLLFKHHCIPPLIIGYFI